MKITIGIADFAVSFVENLHDDGRTLLGEIDYARREIHIDKDVCNAEQHTILWHEVLHGICNRTGIELSEKDITALAYQVSEVLEYNMELQCVDNFLVAKDETCE